MAQNQKLEAVDPRTLPIISNPLGATFIGYSGAAGAEQTGRVAFASMTPLFGVVQTTGTSILSVMSQKAVTDALVQKADVVDAGKRVLREIKPIRILADYSSYLVTSGYYLNGTGQKVAISDSTTKKFVYRFPAPIVDGVIVAANFPVADAVNRAFIEIFLNKADGTFLTSLKYDKVVNGKIPVEWADTQDCYISFYTVYKNGSNYNYDISASVSIETNKGNNSVAFSSGDVVNLDNLLKSTPIRGVADYSSYFVASGFYINGTGQKIAVSDSVTRKFVFRFPAPIIDGVIVAANFPVADTVNRAFIEIFLNKADGTFLTSLKYDKVVNGKIPVEWADTQDCYISFYTVYKNGSNYNYDISASVSIETNSASEGILFPSGNIFNPNSSEAFPTLIGDVWDGTNRTLTMQGDVSVLFTTQLSNGSLQVKKGWYDNYKLFINGKELYFRGNVIIDYINVNDIIAFYINNQQMLTLSQPNGDLMVLPNEPDLSLSQKFNPVLLRGSGTWDSGDIANPDVVEDTLGISGHKYIMNFSAYGTVSGVTDSKWRMCLAYSNDLENWTRDVANPIFSPNADEGVMAANGSIVILGNSYYHFYQRSLSGTTASAQICLATSPDLRTWTRQNGGNPVILPTAGTFDSVACYDPCVRVYDDTFYMLYSAAGAGGSHAIGFATSTNGIDWVKKGAMVTMSGGPSEPSFCKIGKIWYLSHDIYTNSPVNNSREIFGSWWDGETPVTTKKIMSNGGAPWKSAAVFDSALLYADGRLYMHYAGGNQATTTQGLNANIGISAAQI